MASSDFAYYAKNKVLYFKKKKFFKKLWKMFLGLPPNQDKRDSHDLIRILGNGKDFQDILQNLDVTQDKS